MILQRLILLFPETAPAIAWFWFALLTGAGLLLYLAGSRVSRSIITLTVVFAGALLGKHAPAFFGWHVDPMSTTIGAAVVLGLLAYVFHHWVVAFGLASLLALWTALGIWIHAATPTTWTWPTLTNDWATLAKDFHTVAGPELLQQCAALSGLAFMTGLALAILFSRLATALFWTGFGATVAVTSALAWCLYLAPTKLNALPSSTPGQLLLLIAILLVGFLAQWKANHRPAPEKRPAPAEPTPAFA